MKRSNVAAGTGYGQAGRGWQEYWRDELVRPWASGCLSPRCFETHFYLMNAVMKRQLCCSLVCVLSPWWRDVERDDIGRIDVLWFAQFVAVRPSLRFELSFTYQDLWFVCAPLPNVVSSVLDERRRRGDSLSDILLRVLLSIDRVTSLELSLAQDDLYNLGIDSGTECSVQLCV